MSQHPRLPWQADLVVRASREQSDIEKLVWCEDRGLNQGPEGCYLSGRTLGDRLGRSQDTIERSRRELVRLGLHRTQRHPGTKSASWFALLPNDAVPVCPPAVADPDKWRPDPAEVRRLADRLDAHIRGIRGPRAYERTGGTDAAPKPGLAAGQPTDGGTDAVTNGGRTASRMAAAVPPRSKQLGRERSSSSSGEFELVAHATKAEAKNGNPQGPQGTARLAGPELRCDSCGEPLDMTAAGRLKPCSRCAVALRASEAWA